MRRSQGSPLIHFNGMIFSLTLLVFGLPLCIATGCKTNPYRVQKDPPTLKDFAKDYRRVFDTAREIIAKHPNTLIRVADRSSGEIEAESLMNNKFLQPSRMLIHVFVTRKRGYHDIEVRVLQQVDDSEPDTIFSKRVQHRKWRTLASDNFLETSLTNKIKMAITKGAYVKEPGKANKADPETKTKKPKSKMKAPKKKESIRHGNDQMGDTEDTDSGWF